MKMTEQQWLSRPLAQVDPDIYEQIQAEDNGKTRGSN